MGTIKFLTKGTSNSAVVWFVPPRPGKKTVDSCKMIPREEDGLDLSGPLRGVRGSHREVRRRQTLVDTAKTVPPSDPRTDPLSVRVPFHLSDLGYRD